MDNDLEQEYIVQKLKGHLDTFATHISDISHTWVRQYREMDDTPKHPDITFREETFEEWRDKITTKVGGENDES